MTFTREHGSERPRERTMTTHQTDVPLKELIPAASKVASRNADYDADGYEEILVTSPWGMAILKHTGLTGTTMRAPVLASNGTRFGGGWVLNTTDNVFIEPGHFDADRGEGILVASPWGVAILKQAGGTMRASMMAQNGTRFGDWAVHTADNVFGPVGDYGGAGDGVLVTSPWGMAVLQQTGSTMTAPMMAQNGTRFPGGWLLNTTDNRFGPVGHFGNVHRERIVVTSPWGMAVLEQSGNTMRTKVMAPNGTRFGDWVLDTATDSFGPVGDFAGRGTQDILVTGRRGIALLRLREDEDTFSTSMIAANGTRFPGGWLLNTADNRFGPVGGFNGGIDQLLVTSPWGIAVLDLEEDDRTFSASLMAANGTRFHGGGWLLNTADNRFGSAARYRPGTKHGIVTSSPWGMAIVEGFDEFSTYHMMAPNGTRFGGWLLNTADNDLGFGV
ncbi:hypothetical protein GWI34_17310 [Actinomadura sp. DSM 109109]|nr:hypothetical protein [Actinomadura lepetitiana]